ncbi:helix-turn-helix domain-containing protein [Comamonas resistens]|uniref:helix-turn-helix domain-containing protein n=1 Tax=Comamonas resistens TaxID=3046670 RepID=UPI0039BD0E68
MSEEKNFPEAGARIRALRGKATQGEFADQMGVNRKTVERWESGERLPDGQSLLALMAVFGADVNYILTGKKPSDAGPSLSAEESTLLDYFRAANPEVRRAAMGALLGAAAPATRYTVNYGEAKIKQASAGDIVNKGRRK